MGKLTITTLLLFFLLQNTCAQVELNDNLTTAYNHIIALRLNEARLILAEEKNLDQDNLMIPYLENYIDFLLVFINEDEEEFEFLEENKTARISRIKQLDDSSRFKNYMLGNIHLQWAVARLKFGEYFTAAIEINKAYRLLVKNSKRFPEFIPNNISLGVLHIMIGMVPKQYQWLLNLINMEGSVEQGRDELYLVLRSSNENEVYAYLHNETLFYLGFVELNIQPDTGKINQLKQELQLASTDNLLLSYLYINMLMRTGQNDEALQKFEELEMSNIDFIPFFYLDYLKAECYLRKLESHPANRHLDLFLDNFKGRNFIRDAYRKKAWTQLLDGHDMGYRAEIANVLTYGNDDIDIDREAEREAESGSIPNADLIRARLLFDGGYYLKADSVLQGIDSDQLSEEMELERTYRAGRVAHKSGNMEKSKACYLNTIEQGSESERYYAGNASLKMGEIYESERNPDSALYYYKLCLDLNFDEYEASIHAKAKAAVERLSE